MKIIISPITLNNNVQLIKKIPKKDIIKSYRTSFKIDVSSYFENIDYISIYKCNDTKYEFYYPFDVAGDSSFYEHFQQFKNYYMPWKWEHEIALKYINSGDKILEVGCAHGDFLKKLSTFFVEGTYVGLELNKTSPKSSNRIVEIRNETIQDFSKNNKNKFDVVCSFQVLEHIPEVNSFIKASIDCLNPGGFLIISVPNNDSYLKNIRLGHNCPPHHMGLWNESALLKLQEYFNIKFLEKHFEPLQEYHVDTYLYSEYFHHHIPNLLARILWKINILTHINKKRKIHISTQRDNIIGHTILMVYKKY